MDKWQLFLSAALSNILPMFITSILIGQGKAVSTATVPFYAKTIDCFCIHNHCDAPSDAAIVWVPLLARAHIDPFVAGQTV